MSKKQFKRNAAELNAADEIQKDRVALHSYAVIFIMIMKKTYKHLFKTGHPTFLQ